jgi:type I restriction enzyme S subunit
MSEWASVTLAHLATLRKGINYKSEDYGDEHSGHPFITIKCFVKGGGYEPTGIKFYDGFPTKADYLSVGDLLFSVTDLTRAGDIVGSPLKVPDFGRAKPALASMDCMRIAPIADRCDKRFLYHRLMLSDVRRQMVAYSAGSTVLHLDTKKVPSIVVRIPVDVRLQEKIANILDGIDTAIEKTEALIAKYQQIKAGLMHDLFTCGVLPNGQLRPSREQAPELYQETAIGWIPREWEVKDISAVLDSIADGPFGSNLKTEHYVVDPGVRVVRLQNVAEYQYNDGDRAYISDRHAAYLVRNKVVGGDVLIAGLGEERYPVGRACTYPAELPPAINKADCFRARCIADVMYNKFLMLFLNSELARHQIRRYEQGVTRPRINTGNLKRLAIGVPTLCEQAAFVSRFEAALANIHAQQAIVENLKSQKLGLMQDLLTGKVPVKVGAGGTANG